MRKQQQAPRDVIDFWFSESAKDKWWKSNQAFDEEIRQRFSDLHRRAKAGELRDWRVTPEGRLAEIIVLDQFSRNMFRNSGEAFAQDELARMLTRQAVACGADQALPVQQRAFLYLPLMHSESLDDHVEAMKLFASDPGLASNLDFEIRHKAIIERFGRYPHRNEVLGRKSTKAELDFLQQPGSSF